MLTDHDKMLIDKVLQDKETDIIYRSWTRRVKKKLKELRSLDDEVLNRQLTMLNKRLLYLEKVYTKRIMAVSLTSLAEKFEVAVSTIASISKRSIREYDNYMKRDNIQYAEAANLTTYLSRIE